MASLKDLRNRIATVKATQKVTKAMQLVASTKLRKVQLTAENSRPYAKRMERAVHNLGWRVSDLADASPLLVGTGSEQRMLCIVATTERGLCGGLNSNIIKHFKEHVDHFIANGKEVNILCVGGKGYKILKNSYGSMILDTVSLRHVRQLKYHHANEIAKRILELFAEDKFDVCCIFYAKFGSINSQRPRSTQLIPAVYAKAMTLAEMNAAEERACGYDYEPDEREVLNDLLPRNIATQIYRALLENAASEQGARMVAMEHATTNAGELIGKLTLEFNRKRQAQITNELMEIIAGSEALK